MELEVGTVLCDLHDGIDIPDGWRIESSLVVPAIGASGMIQETLMESGASRFYCYCNKHLVVTGVDHKGRIIAMGSYDDRALHIYRLVEVSE